MAAKYSCLRSDVAAGLLILPGRSLRRHAAARLQLLLPVSNNFVAVLQAGGDDDSAALGQSNLHRPHLDRVVGVHYVSEGAVGTAENGAGRRRYRVLTRLQQQVSVDELVGPEHAVGIVKDRLQLGRAGRRINLVVNRQQLARSELFLVVLAVGVNFQYSLLHALPDSLQLLLRYGEDHGNGVQLRNDHHRSIAGSSNVVAGIDLPQSNSPVDGRLDVAIGQIELSVAHGGFVGGDGAFVGPKGGL